MKKPTKTDRRSAKLGEEARAEFAAQERLVDDDTKVPVRQDAEQAPTDERRTGDAETNWDAATDSAEAFPGHVPNTDVNEVDLLGQAAGLTYADDEPLDYSKVDRRDAERWELNPASADEAVDDEEADDDEAEPEDLFGDESLTPEDESDEALADR